MQFESIRLLRAVAALLVVIHHVFQYLALRVSGVRPDVFGFGAFGVDIFFVISGLVMTISVGRGERGWEGSKVFLIRRCIRILPMYWIGTLAIGLAYFAAPNAFSNVQLTVSDLLRSLFFIPVHTSSWKLRPILSQGWTLYFECYFYVVFAAVILSGTRYRTLSTAIVLYVSWMISSRLLGHDVEWVVNSALVFEFMFGCVLGELILQRRIPSIPGFWVPASVVALVFALSASEPQRSDLARVLWWGIPAALLVAAVISLEGWLRDKIGRFLALLGDASYSTYLFHGIAFTLLGRLAGAERLSLAPSLWAMLLVAFAVVASIGAYALIERPVTAALRAAMRRDAPPLERHDGENAGWLARDERT